jgi:hypothetical protein
VGFVGAEQWRPFTYRRVKANAVSRIGSANITTVARNHRGRSWAIRIIIVAAAKTEEHAARVAHEDAGGVEVVRDEPEHRAEQGKAEHDAQGVRRWY